MMMLRFTGPCMNDELASIDVTRSGVYEVCRIYVVHDYLLQVSDGF